ncbi:WXG100 family type VII secretion target [Nocardia sp. NPDC050710]|uniref:WXG100 family type VII secretion target n=1 Tax=Nocardia sp. NPDC050710 TaxID=3157220 RepID=UPI0033F8B93C
MRHSVDLDQLDAVVGRLKGFEGFLDEQINALDQAVTNLQTNWDGDAASAQAAAHAKLMEAAKEIHEGMSDMREAAAAAHGRYTAAIAANVAMWRS